MLRRGLTRLVVRQLLASGHVRLVRTCVQMNAAPFENDYSRMLYTKLSLDTNYQYLDPDIDLDPDPVATGPVAARLIATIQNREENLGSKENLEAEVLKSFKDWTRSVQLRVGFIMHLNDKISSKEYLNRVIQHITSGENLHTLAPHELVALLLLIYFRKDFTVEDISEYLNLEVLQTVFANRIEEGHLNSAEVCAGCLGLKKIKDLKIQNQRLRSVLYGILDNKDTDNKFKDFFLMTVVTSLSKGNQVFHDTEAQVEKAFDTFTAQIGSVSLMTAVKMMSFGINGGHECPKLNGKVYGRLLSSLDDLNLKDIVAISNFFSKSSDVDLKILLSLKGELIRIMEKASSVEDLVDVLKCLSFLCINEVYSEEMSATFLEAFKSIEPSDVKRSNLQNIAAQVVRSVAETSLNRENILSDLDCLKSNPAYVSTLCRIPAFLCFNLRLDRVDIQHPMSMDTAASLLALFQKKLPLQLQSPQMSCAELDNRSRLLVNCYRGLNRIMGTERFTGVARILPQFPEPDLVFGNIGGTAVAPPEYITDPKILRPKRAPAGDWWVLIMANRKNLNSDQKMIGIDEIKVRQLKSLGFTPIIVPYSSLNSVESAVKILPRLLHIDHVDLPNLDDGMLERTKKF